jgi:hypothetical protein
MMSFAFMATSDTDALANVRRAWRSNVDRWATDSSLPAPARVVFVVGSQSSSKTDLPHHVGTSSIEGVSQEWSSRFASLLSVLNLMRDLPRDDEQAIDEETKADAELLLSYMRTHDIPPPKLFSHGGDAVVFTWEQPDVLRYLTVSGGDFSVLDMHRRTRMKCKSELTPIRSQETDDQLQRLRGVAYIGSGTTG